MSKYRSHALRKCGSKDLSPNTLSNSAPKTRKSNEKAPFDHRSPHRVDELETRKRITGNFESGVEPLKIITGKIDIQSWHERRNHSRRHEG